ncbi:EpsG family protein [Pedobacter jeongneungensis]|uniref:EpsG family protein n=1 Tax=Pedobacter jeongneungensis TaxID=947309 RepID=UPI0004684A88|nr:EpsG family protein [Pedobacter jeongneungensis]
MYIFTFSLLGLFAIDDVFLKKGKYAMAFFFFAIVLLIFHDGLRWGIGTDWNIYREYFEDCLDNNRDNFEIGYMLLSQAIRIFTSNYSVFLVVHAIIVYGLISKSIFRFAVNPLFSIFFFYCIMLTYLGMNRQYISFAICIYSYKFIFDKKIINFLACIAIAFLFHKSALFFIFAYFLNREFKNKYLISILGTVLIISLFGLMNKLPLDIFFLFSESIGDKVTFYAESNFLTTNVFLTILALLKRSIWIMLAVAFRSRIKNMDAHFNFFFNLYFIGAIIYILFNNTILQVVVARGVLYFNIAEIFLIPYILTIFKNDFTRKLVFILVAIYGMLTIQKGMNFYKEDLGFDIYRPYNSVLWDSNYNAYDQ